MKTLLRIKHIFTGHLPDSSYDDKYIYCGCGWKMKHNNSEIAKSWIFPHIDCKKTKEDLAIFNAPIK